MPGILHGRILLAATLVGWGVLSLIYVDFVSSLEPVPTSLPGFGVLAILNGLFLLAVGLLLLANFKVYPAAIAVAIMFALWILVLHVPSAFMNPALLRSPFWIRVFESLALGSGALILAGLASTPVREHWVRTGRILFGISLPVFAILHFIYAEFTATLVPPWYPWPLFWAWFTGAAHLAAGVAIASGILARPAALLAGLMYGLWALTLHLPRQFMQETVAYNGVRNEVTSMLVAVAFCGVAWIVAGTLAQRRGASRGRTAAMGDAEDAAPEGTLRPS